MRRERRDRMIKTLETTLKMDTEKYTVPRKVQDYIPIRRVWSDGVFVVGNKFAKTFLFSDINYFAASLEDQGAMLRKYRALLSALDCTSTTKITINNRRIDLRTMEENVFMPMKGDALDEYRREYNRMLTDAITGTSIIQEKYITVSVHRKNVSEARTFFRRIETELSMQFSSLGSSLIPLDALDKLRILHDFYRPGDESCFTLDLNEKMRLGHSLRDYICPDSLERRADYIKLGDTYARVLFLKDYASYIHDDFIKELTDLHRNLMLSIDIIPVPTDEAVREVESRLLGVETNITNWQRRQNSNNNFSAIVPYDLDMQRQESKEFLHRLTSKNEGMLFGILTMVHTSKTKAELDSDTETILSIARRHMCQMAKLKYQQMDGLNTVLPLGVRKINALRTLTTQSLSVFLPFNVQEIFEAGGVCVGENAISHNPLLLNIANLMNQSMFLLGIPGSGKSFFAKLLIVFFALATGDDILICDPEGEYAPLVKAIGGEVIHIAVGSRDHINAMDMAENYSDQNPVMEKSQFIMSLLEQLDQGGVNSYQKSIVDRCTAAVYAQARKTGKTPTLCTLREKLLEQPEPEAQGLALALELFTAGSLDIFAHETNVDTANRIIVYDIHDLGSQLKPVGLLTITDAMINRVSMNWKKGKRTHLFFDEFHVMLENEHSAEYFTSAWKQLRKRNACPCGITQNAEYLLDPTKGTAGSTLLSNSECIVMLNQAASDREMLAKLLNISQEQLSYITNAEAGSGLIRYGGSLVPFVSRFPRDTKLYQLMTTKPGEGVF